MIFTLSCSLDCYFSLPFFTPLERIICRSRLSSSSRRRRRFSLVDNNQLHLFAKCFYLHSNKKSIDKHAREWCRRAASSSSSSSSSLRLVFLSLFIWSFNFMQRETSTRTSERQREKERERERWLIDFSIYEYTTHGSTSIVFRK